MTHHFLNLAPGQTAPVKLFFGEKLGVFDTIDQPFEDIDRFVRLMRSLDWDEYEKPMQGLRDEFKNADPVEVNQLVDTIAWQWETDTTAARMLVPTLAPLVSYDGLNRLYTRIQDNECVHAATYSEITRYGFADPVQVKLDIMARQAAFERLRPAIVVFDEMYEASLDYARGIRPYSQELADLLLKYLYTLLCMEGTQFAASFSVAAYYNLNGKFMPATNNIQKIAQDELRVHVPVGMAVLDHFLRTNEGLMAFNNCRDWMIKMGNTIVQSEITWNNEVLFKERQSLQGDRISHSAVKADRYVHWRQQQTTDFMRLPTVGERIDAHPIPWIEDWVSISMRQGSPQEDRPTDYLLTPVIRRLPAGPMKLPF